MGYSTMLLGKWAPWGKWHLTLTLDNLSQLGSELGIQRDRGIQEMVLLIHSSAPLDLARRMSLSR